MLENIASLLFLFLPVFLLGILIEKIKISEKILKLSLAFSAAYLLTLSLSHLLPQLFSDGSKIGGWFILTGFFIQLFLEFFSTGIEHGHVHLHKKNHQSALPTALFFGLFIHSFLEGIPVSSFVNSIHNDGILTMRNSLIIGIVLHNIPVTVALVTLLKSHEVSRIKFLLILILFALMAPLGSLFGNILEIMNFGNIDLIIRFSLGVVIGIFLHISTTIMFENSENHRYNYQKLISIVMGVLMACMLS